MKGTWLRILGLLVFVGVLALAGGWWMMHGQGGSGPSVADSSKAAPVTPVSDEKPLPAPNKNSLTLPGVIEPFEAIPVSARLTATIASLTVRDGSAVRKGQLLCTLDNIDIRKEIDSARLAYMQAAESLRSAKERRDSEAERKRLALSQAQEALDSYRTQSDLDLQKAEAALKRAERELADSEALYKAKAVSADDVRAKREAVEDAKRSLELTQTSITSGLSSRQKSLEQAKLDARTESVSEQNVKAGELAAANARVELNERQSRLVDTRVIAPIGGTVRIISRTRTSSMTASGQSAEVLGPGVRVFEGDPFLEIATTERACIRVEVDETDIARLRIGMPAKITGDAFAGRELKGEIATIQTSGRRAGEGVSLFPITILITSPLEGVRMGMTADVVIELGETR